jgi:hypothetical protein
MKLFIWERVAGVTDSWHDEGGLTVIAPTLERARELIENECQGCTADKMPPDLEICCDPSDEQVFVFPDAGCC